MATKDDRPGLLSKVAMFVRNPTKDWSELDRPEPEQESGYDKQALKAMIERKRQNDFVRKREFDQLRKLRNRDPSAAAALARPSFFQTSIPTDPDGRAMTLKKIDEIEAQMSKQWWKGKQDAAAAAQPGFPVATPPEGEVDLPVSVVMPNVAPPATVTSVFDTTETSELHSSVPGADASQYAPTQVGALGPPLSSHVPLRGRADAAMPVEVPGLMTNDEVGDLTFSTSKLFAIEVGDMATDPELEEAAIRFANGDDAGAENGLLNALRSMGPGPESYAAWAAALLDLYRATNNRARFDWAVVELAHLWGHGVPVWATLAETSQGLETTAAAPFAASGTGRAVLMSGNPIWRSPAELTEASMETLREALSSQPMPWLLDWSALRSVDAPAMGLLGGLFGSLCDEAVALQFSGAKSLVQVLRALTPSGDRGVSADWWAVRLNALRTMQMLDEFELAALDYCVTYEVSPPAWEPARCHYESAEVAGAAHSVTTSADAATVPMGLDSVRLPGLELRGEVLGDATQALAGLESGQVRGGRIVVSCKHLIRVDFSAAGSILNWVALRQAEGHLVQFQDVHRLVAAFFNVIGINEHARVVLRTA
ncbi:MAG: STAS domain-containing protein [Rhodoferax sp.]|nr:STAS domain-containing protein [Rhodoferax sp.]